MAVFLDVLPRLGLTEAESAFAKLKDMAKKAGDEAGISFSNGASEGLAKLKEASVSAERSVSDDFRKMSTSAAMYEAQIKKVSEVEAARGRDSAAYATAMARQNDLMMKATAAEKDHAASSLVAADASAKFASAKDNAGKSVLTTAGILNGVGAASFLAFGAAIGLTSDKAMDFQASQERLVTSAGESAQNLKLVSDGILQMAGTVGTSSSDLSKGMYTVESAGYHAADGLTVLKAAAQLAKSENADLTTTTDAVTTALHDYHLPADQAAEVSSKLVTAVSQGKTTVEAFAGSLHSVQPLAASLGININDLYGSLAAMTASGESADQSTQNMADALRHLASPTLQMSKNLSDVGLDARQLSANLGTTGLAGTMQEISEAVLQHMGPSGMVLLDTFNRSKQAADDANTMFKALPPTLQQIAQTAQTTGDFTSFRKAIGGMNLETRNLATEWLSAMNNAEGFNNKLKSGGSDVETYTQALQGAVGDASSLNVALQLSGENAAKTSQNINELADAHKNADGSVKGFNETEETMKQKLDEAKAGFGAAAIEIGTLFLPALTDTINALKDAAEYLAQHKALLDGLIITVGALGTAWVVTKAAMAIGGLVSDIGKGLALIGGFVTGLAGKYDALAVSAEAAAAAERDAANAGPGSFAKGGAAGASARGAAGTIGAAGAMVGGVWGFLDLAQGVKDANDPNHDETSDRVARARGGGRTNADQPAPGGGTLPVAAPDQYGGAGAQAARRGVYAPPAPGIPTPPPGTDPGAIQDAAPADATPFPSDGGGGGGGGSSAEKAKKAKTPAGSKDDPVWIAPQKPEDFKNTDSDGSSGTTGSSILKGGFNFLDPKSIGTFFTALLADLALGNPLGTKFANEKAGSSPGNPMYVSSVDVDRAQQEFDRAIQNNGPDSAEAKRAGLKLQATKAAVGTTGGYFDPLTGTFSQSAGTGINSDAGLLANVPSGQYTQAQHDLAKGLDDCSGAVGDLVKIMDGQPTGGPNNLNTGNAASWLPAHGFVPGMGGPGDFRVGYNAEHMQATLPGGTNFNWGSAAAAASGGVARNTGAFDPAFTQHYYRPAGSGPVGAGDGYGGGDSSLYSPANTDAGLNDPADLSDVPSGIGGTSGGASGFKRAPGMGGVGVPGANLVNAALRPAPNAAPGSDQSQSQPEPRSWGSGKGFSTSIASTLGSAAGGMFPGGGAAAATAGKLADRTIGYLGQLGGIAAEGLMQSLIPTGGGGGIGDPSHSVLGKLAGGIAGAHKSAGNSAGTTAPPGPKKDDDKDGAKKPQGGDTHIQTQQHGGINTQGGDVHITAPNPQAFASDQPQNQYQFSTR